MKYLTEQEIQEELKRLGVKTDTELRNYLEEYQSYYSDSAEDQLFNGDSTPGQQGFNE